MLDALPFGGKASSSIESIHGAVKALVRRGRFGRHQIGIVEVGQRCVRIGGSGIEHGLREWVQFRQVSHPLGE